MLLVLVLSLSQVSADRVDMEVRHMMNWDLTRRRVQLLLRGRRLRVLRSLREVGGSIGIHSFMCMPLSSVTMASIETVLQL